MGDRCAIGFQSNQEIKATYSHWGSHPSQNGKKISDFLSQLSAEQLSRLKSRARDIQWVSAKNAPSPDEIKRYKPFAGFKEVYPGKLDDWFFLLHKTQGVAGLVYLLTGQLDHFVDNTNFLNDSLMCEWGYIINFDAHTLDVYEGLQITPDPRNPLGQAIAHTFEGKSFYPCKCVYQLELNNPMSNLAWAKRVSEE